MPEKIIGPLAAGPAAKLIAASSDIAIVLDKQGVIRDVALAREDLAEVGHESWRGQPWEDTVTIESRPKVQQLLREAHGDDIVRSREINHPSVNGLDVPIRYSAVPLGKDGRVVAIGHDLRTLAKLQQKLVDAQRSMERDYARLRQSETRYRLLFQATGEPVLIVDATTLKVTDGNPAANAAVARTAGALIGEPLAGLFDAASRPALEAAIGAARNLGHVEGVALTLADTGRPCVAGLSLFRQENAAHLLVRLSAPGGAAAPKSRVPEIVEALPDALVVTDARQIVRQVNPAFLELAQLGAAQQAQGQPIERWLGRPGVDLGIIVSNLREHDSVRHYGTILRGELGSREEVEVTAVSVRADPPCFGFVIRPAQRSAAIGVEGLLPKTPDQLAELVGRVPLKDLVRGTTDVIERLCIEAALKLTGDNRAAAAQMLGLSRQSLYSKLRRFGHAVPDDEE
jgi:transcriptional regulator PpsR